MAEEIGCQLPCKLRTYDLDVAEPLNFPKFDFGVEHPNVDMGIVLYLRSATVVTSTSSTSVWRPQNVGSRRDF